MSGLITVDGNICMQTNAHIDTRVQSATEELRAARLAFCQALLKVQGLEQDSWNKDEGYRRLLPAGLGQALIFVVVTINKCHAYVCVTHQHYALFAHILQHHTLSKFMVNMCCCTTPGVC